MSTIISRECYLGGQCHRHGVSISILLHRERPGEVVERDLGPTRNSEELIVWVGGSRVFNLGAEFRNLKPACKEKLSRGGSLIFLVKTP
jgi:hypothetical protein